MRRARSVTLLLAVLCVATGATGARAREQTPTWPREAENPTAPKPAPPFRDWYLVIGEYESAAAPGRPAVHLYVLERDGRLMMIADRGSAVDLDTMSSRPVFTRDRARRATAMVIGGVAYRRLQVGPDDGGQLQVTPVRPVAEVLKESQALTPPVEPGTFLPADLVELTTLEPSIKLDVRYATTNNFLGSVFYAEPRAFLQRPAAEAVARVHRALAPFGYGLLVHDGYRPWYVTRTFWETTPADRKWLVANPAQGSRHNRGAAVDLTLYDLKTGAVVAMPSTYDESTPRAYAFYPGGTSLERWHRALLRRLMEAEGFTVNPQEWWHFDYKDWQRYAIGNIAFDRIRERGRGGLLQAHRRVPHARVRAVVRGLNGAGCVVPYALLLAGVERLHVIPKDMWIGADQREPFDHRLCHEQPIERVVVARRKQTHAQHVLHPRVQGRYSVVHQLRDELASAAGAERELARCLLDDHLHHADARQHQLARVPQQPPPDRRRQTTRVELQP